MSQVKITPKTYREYLAEDLCDPALAYDDAVKNVSLRADGISPVKGAAEALSDAGLLKSGYAAYLKKQADDALAKGYANAAKEYRNSRDTSFKSYGDYLKNVAEKNAVSYENVYNAIKKKGTVKESEAYEYALEEGLSDADARRAAKTATEETLTALKKKIIAVVQRDGMGREHAIAYAVGQGLPEEFAEEIGDYADSWNRIYKKSDSIKEFYNQ